MKTSVLQRLTRYMLTVLTITLMSVLLNACALDMNDIFGIRKADVNTAVAVPPAKVKVTYNGNGNDSGTAPADDNEYTPREMAMIMTNSGGLALAGHTFSGWNTKPDGSGTGYEPSSRTPQGFTVGDKDLTLYAVWSKDVHIKAGETYTGQIKGNAVHIDAGGVWDVKGFSSLMYLDTVDLVFDGNKIVTGSIKDNGNTIYYDEDQSQNGLSVPGTYELPGGGKLMPKLPHDIEASMNAVHYIDGTAKAFANEKISIDKNFLNRSAVLVKNGGVATIEHSAITASSSSVPMEVSYDAAARWGLGSALYSCMAGVLIADDVRIVVKDGASAGAFASYLGFIKLTNSTITCSDSAGRNTGVQASYGGRIDLENLSIETRIENGSLMATGPGGGTIQAKNITGVAGGKGSAALYAGGYGEIAVQGSNLKTGDESVVVICEEGTATVKDSTLISATTAIKTHHSNEDCCSAGTGTFINTKIVSGGDAFYFTGMSVDVTVQDGVTVEYPEGCKLIRVDSKGTVPASSANRQRPVKCTFTAMNVKLNGDIEVVEDGAMLQLSLKEGTVYKGAVFGASVSIDDTSEWTVTETCIIAGIDFSSASRIVCPKGLRVYYDATITNLGIVDLKGGGELAPIQES